METLGLVLLLLLPFAMLLGATRLRKARERALDEKGVPRAVSSTAKPWDKGMRNAMLVALSGLLLVIAGTYAYSVAAGTRAAPAFAAPIVLGVLLIVRAWRLWTRAVDQIPDA